MLHSSELLFPCSCVHLILWIPSATLSTRSDTELAIKLTLLINSTLLNTIFVSISFLLLPNLLTSFYNETEKVLHFSIFSPKQLNSPSNLTFLLSKNSHSFIHCEKPHKFLYLKHIVKYLFYVQHLCSYLAAYISSKSFTQIWQFSWWWFDIYFLFVNGGICFLSKQIIFIVCYFTIKRPYRKNRISTWNMFTYFYCGLSLRSFLHSSTFLIKDSISEQIRAYVLIDLYHWRKLKNRFSS